MFNRYRQALNFTLKPHSPIKEWQLYIILGVGYCIVPLVFVIFLGIFGLFLAVLCAILTGALIKKWLHYIRGNTYAASVAVSRLLWIVLSLVFLIDTVKHIHDFPDTGSKVAASIFTAIFILLPIWMLVDGNKELRKIERDNIKDIPKKELFQ